MATVSTADPGFRSALESCIAALKRLAEYEADPSLNRLVHELGERKEFLDSEEHAELCALVAFEEQRSLEKLEAQVALRRLREALPDLAEAT